MKTPRLVIGRDYMNPFAGISCGDVFRDTFGHSYTWTGTTLYPSKGEECEADYSRTPHPYFTNLSGFNDFCRRVNWFADNPNDYKNGAEDAPFNVRRPAAQDTARSSRHRSSRHGLTPNPQRKQNE